MDVLVTYGFHKAEAEFGKRVVKAYNRDYSFKNDGVEFVRIANSSIHDDLASVREAYNELGNLIDKHAPKILVDLHHSDCAVPEGINIPDGRIEGRRFPSANEFVFSHPTIIFFNNYEMNQKLNRYFRRNKYLGCLYYDHLSEESIKEIAKEMAQSNRMSHSDFEASNECIRNNFALDMARSNKVSYITLEAMINIEKQENGEDKIKEDKEYELAFYRTLLFIHTMQRFARKD